MKNETTKTDTTTPAQKEVVTRKLRDLSLDDLDAVVGGISRGCDNNVGSVLS